MQTDRPFQDWSYSTQKKENPMKNPDLDSYPRITVVSNLGKFVEKEMMCRSEPATKAKQDPLQFRFTAGCSPSVCALLILPMQLLKQLQSTIHHLSGLQQSIRHGRPHSTANCTLWPGHRAKPLAAAQRHVYISNLESQSEWPTLPMCERGQGAYDRVKKHLLVPSRLKRTCSWRGSEPTLCHSE